MSQIVEPLALTRRGTDLEQRSCAGKDALDTGYGHLVLAVGHALRAAGEQLNGDKGALLSALFGFTPPPKVPNAVLREDVDGAPTGRLSYVVTAQPALWVARLASAARRQEMSVLVVGPDGGANGEDGATAATSFAKRFVPDSVDVVVIADADRVPLPVGVLAGIAARSAVWVVGVTETSSCRSSRHREAMPRSPGVAAACCLRLGSARHLRPTATRSW